jgi:hypothetical protein
MRSLVRFLVIVLAMAVALPLWGDDQQKAEKELNRITALASDGVGRTVVNQSMAQYFNAKRPDLVLERRDTGLNYGQLFVMRTLVAAGAKQEEIAASLKAGKNISQIASEHQLNWKELNNEAKKLNAKIDDNLYTYLLDRKKSESQDQADGYLLTLDGVIADNQVSKSDMDQAGDRYVRIKDRAEEFNRRANRLSIPDQQAAYRDNVRSGGPQGSGGAGPSGGAPPAAGGPR